MEDVVGWMVHEQGCEAAHSKFRLYELPKVSCKQIWKQIII